MLRDTAAAAGSFAVVALHNDVEDTFTEATIYEASSLGGVDLFVQQPQGGGVLRPNAVTGVDIAVVGSSTYALMPDEDDRELNSGADSYHAAIASTSAATPKAAAAAAVFAHWYETSFGVPASPGQIYSSLQLFGDRRGVSVYRERGFDPLYGAGRLKMADLVGDPNLSFHVDVGQVDDGATTTLPLLGPAANGGRLPKTIKDLKVVMWWFEPWAYERGPLSGAYPAADIKFRLRSFYSASGCSGGDVKTVRVVDDSFDVKKMIYSTDPDVAGNCLVADLEGPAVSRTCMPNPKVPISYAVCGPRRTAYVAWMYRT